MSRQGEIELTWYNEDGDEVTHSFPSEHEVCPRCEGHGTHLTPSIGNHAYSMEEFYESFDDEEDREAYFQRGGKYDVTCERCGGKNVIEVVAEGRLSDEQKKLYAEYEAAEDKRTQDEADDRRTRWYEDGCPMD